MRLISSILLCAAVSKLFAEQNQEGTPASSPATLSSRLAAEIRATLPKYQPHPEKSENEAPAAPTDPDILVLPKVVVKQSAPPRILDNDLLKKKALNKRLIHEYENSLEGLDAILNGFSVPLFAPSMKARARGAYKQRKLDDLNNLIETNEVDHGGEELKKARDDMLRADDWQHHLVK